MKTALRAFIFSLIAVLIAQNILGGLVFKGNYPQTFLLFVLGLSFLYFFLKPILAIIALPGEGVGFLFITFILTAVFIHVLLIFVPVISIRASHLSNLIIFGFVLPSKNLSAFETSIFSALVISLVYTFFNWLCSKK